MNLPLVVYVLGTSKFFKWKRLMTNPVIFLLLTVNLTVSKTLVGKLRILLTYLWEEQYYTVVCHVHLTYVLDSQ